MDIFWSIVGSLYFVATVIVALGHLDHAVRTETQRVTFYVLATLLGEGLIFYILERSHAAPERFIMTMQILGGALIVLALVMWALGHPQIRQPSASPVPGSWKARVKARMTSFVHHERTLRAFNWLTIIVVTYELVEKGLATVGMHLPGHT